MKFVLVTGGVASGIGKGITLASIGINLQRSGLSVTTIKIDPYLNYNAGNLSPQEHGEVYVLEDGSEVDLDFGTYERSLNITLTKDNSITAGKVFKNVLDDERRGAYLGKTVQVIPHITDEIQNSIQRVVDVSRADICLIELGGTVGDIESMAFVEALRQFKIHNSMCVVHVTLVPQLTEHKTKPTQHSLIAMRSLGLEPNILICRSKDPMCDTTLSKLKHFSGIPVINLPDYHDLSSIPDYLENHMLRSHIVKILHLTQTPYTPVDPSRNYKLKVSIAIIRKYNQNDAYLSLEYALRHAAHYLGVDIEFLDDYTKANGVLVPGGFGERGLETKIEACTYARENSIPFLGICLGMQIAVIEYYRNVLHQKFATSEEFTPVPQQAVVKELADMRLGSKKIYIQSECISRDAYDEDVTTERHRHRFYVPFGVCDETLMAVATDKSKQIAEIVELKNHPFYVGVQYHPEYTSRSNKPSPIILKFLATIILELIFKMY